MAKRTDTKNTWIDMTDLLLWRGSFTGIQRVIYEYAIRFVKDGSKLCAYDKNGDRFFRVDIGVIEEKINSKSNNNSQPLTLRRRMRLFIGRPYYSLPENVKSKLRPSLGVVNHIVRYSISKLMSINSKRISYLYNNLPDADFKKGDTVLLLGAGWNERACFDKLKSIKEKTGIRIAHHVNDILPIYQPQLFSKELPGIFTPYINTVVKHSDIITVISEATKRDLSVFCDSVGVKNLPIEVVRLGDDVKAVDSLRPDELGNIENYILIVGTFEVRKNYMLIYQALKLAQLEGRELPTIVIAGRCGWLTSDLIYIIKNDPFINGKLLWLNNVSDSNLEWLYNNCMFTVFPSLAEGWGLPVAESLRHGKFSIVSGVSSMLEIGKGFVDYFLPYDARECLEKINYYVFEDRYKDLNRKIEKNYTTFTWDESYDQLVKAVSKSKL